MSNLRDNLQAIYDEHKKLTPRLVVDEARSEDHPLHSRFEWDDAVAGENWREHQASELIRSVKIKYVSGEDEREVRYWVSVARKDGHVYKPTEEVASDDVETEIVLRTMEREWKQLERRWGHMKEFFDLLRKALEEEAA